MEEQPSPNPLEKPAEGPGNLELETRIPPSPRELKPEDFALLSRLPTRKPETFDREAISRAAWMVGGLAIGLWMVTLLAKPKAPVEPKATAAPASTEIAPVVMPGITPAPTPEAISLTPAPVWDPPAPTQAPVYQAPPPPAPDLPVEEEPAAETMPEADTPDPSNLFPGSELR